MQRALKAENHYEWEEEEWEKEEEDNELIVKKKSNHNIPPHDQLQIPHIVKRLRHFLCRTLHNSCLHNPYYFATPFISVSPRYSKLELLRQSL